MLRTKIHTFLAASAPEGAFFDPKPGRWDTIPDTHHMKQKDGEGVCVPMDLWRHGNRCGSYGGYGPEGAMDLLKLCVSYPAAHAGGAFLGLWPARGKGTLLRIRRTRQTRNR